MSASLFDASFASSLATLTDAAAGQQGLRRAALFLHGLHPADRDLLLKKVSAGHRQSLVGLLKELDALGIQPEDVQGSLAAWPGPQTQSDAGTAEELDADWLSRADVRAVCDVLTAEPDALMARVLRLNPWPWKAKLLESLDSERRSRVSELLLDPANRHRYHARLDAALLHHLRLSVQHRIAVLTPSSLEARAAGEPFQRGSTRWALRTLWRRRAAGSVV